MLSLLYSEMALLRYFKQKDGLPDPRGALSLSMPSSAIAQANTEVQKAIDSEKPRKRGPYKRYSSTLRAEIGKYASHHGVAAAARYFSRKCEKSVSETTSEYFANSSFPNLAINMVATNGARFFVLHFKHMYQDLP